MKGLKAKDFKDKSVPELEELVSQERAALYKARRDLVFRQITDTASLRIRRKNIAKLLTLIAESKGKSAPAAKQPKAETAEVKSKKKDESKEPKAKKAAPKSSSKREGKE